LAANEERKVTRWHSGGGGSPLCVSAESREPSGAWKILSQKRERKIRCNFTEADVEREEQEQQRLLKAGDRIGDVRDRYDTIVMELLAARYEQTDGKRYSLGIVLRGKCETDKALKEFLQHLGKWIKAFAPRYLHLRVAA
jgi:hypothetical protein